MVICSCYYVSEDDIKNLIKQNKNFEEIQDITNAGNDCGCCIQMIMDLIEEHEE